MKRTILITSLLIPLTACTTWSGDGNDTANEGTTTPKASSTSTSSSDESDYTPLTDEEKKEVTTLIGNRINTYITTPPELGGKYYVTDMRWDTDNTAIFMYEDGHIQGKARVTATVRNGEVTIVQFTEFISE